MSARIVSARGTRYPVRTRAGMSLVEVVVAMAILVGVLLVLGGFSAKFSRSSNQAHLIISANEIAAARLDAVREQPTYLSIDTLIAPWGRDSVRLDRTWFRRRTEITRIGGAPTDSVDYKMITVTVTHPAMKDTIFKTSAVAAF